MAGFQFGINSMVTALQTAFDWFFGILQSAGIPVMMLISSIAVWMFISRYTGAFIGSDARLGRLTGGYEDSLTTDGRNYSYVHGSWDWAPSSGSYRSTIEMGSPYRLSLPPGED